MAAVSLEPAPVHKHSQTAGQNNDPLPLPRRDASSQLVRLISNDEL